MKKQLNMTKVTHREKLGQPVRNTSLRRGQKYKTNNNREIGRVVVTKPQSDLHSVLPKILEEQTNTEISVVKLH